MLMNSFATAWGHTPPIGMETGSSTHLIGRTVRKHVSTRLNG